jgi:hypothetical protein
VAKTHCAVNHHLRARQRVPRISMRRTQPMLTFPSHVELLLPTQFEQFSSVPALYLTLLGYASLLLPRLWFVALLRIAFPFLPASLEHFREADRVQAWWRS